MSKIIFIIPLILILTRCSTPYQGEVAQIDSLLVLMDSAKSVVYKIDTGLMFQRTIQMQNNLAKLSSLVDTLPKKYLLDINNYSMYYKAYRTWSSRIGTLYEEVEVIPMQLTNLRTDLSKNLIEKEKVAEHLKNETEMARLIIESVKRLDVGLKKINQPYIDTEEKVILLIQRLESEKQPES